MTPGPSDFDFDFELAPAAAGRDASTAGDAFVGGGAFVTGGAFEGTSTLPCLAFVQLESDGLAGAAVAQSGTAQTARANGSDSSSDGRSEGRKSRMINRLQRGVPREISALIAYRYRLGPGLSGALTLHAGACQSDVETLNGTSTRPVA